jgi:hypothetical protein
MYETHRTTEAAVKSAPNPIPARVERLLAASIANYVLQLAKSS